MLIQNIEIISLENDKRFHKNIDVSLNYHFKLFNKNYSFFTSNLRSMVVFIEILGILVGKFRISHSSYPVFITLLDFLVSKKKSFCSKTGG